MPTLNFATRPSRLAGIQTDSIRSALQKKWPELNCTVTVIRTEGDRVLDRPLPDIGGKGLFTKELERELLEGRLDAAVHSLKDLPIEDVPGLAIGLIPERAIANDVLISRGGYTLEELPAGSVLGTSSLRRQGQVLAYRPDLEVRSLRGNVDTRVRKVQEGEYDAAILAHAGLARLDLSEHMAQVLPLDIVLPAPGQGALAVQCRSDDYETLSHLAAFEDALTRTAVEAERRFLAALGGGCSLPVGAYAEKRNGSWTMSAVIVAPDGAELLRLQSAGEDPDVLVEELILEAEAGGALKVLHG
ncbi:MAG: hydroxymethylbilane synthase [Anaerolineae bacterium]|nr:MAG: hydroxymethylbilane synthase [Anaerolineae bacterium]